METSSKPQKFENIPLQTNRPDLVRYCLEAIAEEMNVLLDEYANDIFRFTPKHLSIQDCVDTTRVLLEWLLEFEFKIYAETRGDQA